MLKVIVGTLLMLLIPVMSFADIYRWVDDQGVTHFTDKPRPGAAKVHLPEPQTFSPQTLPQQPSRAVIQPSNPEPTQNTTAAATPSYTISITDPTPEQTIPPGFADNMKVTVSVKPALNKGHLVRVLMDDKVVTSGTNTEYTLTLLPPGMHILQAQVVAQKKGQTEILANSAAVTFYVQRPRIKHQSQLNSNVIGPLNNNPAPISLN